MHFKQEYANILQYEVEFSKPSQTKPIPEGTVKVFFNLIQLQNENGEESGYEIEFNFENESLKHKLNNTMRKNMFEVSFHLLYDISNGLIECLKTNSKLNCNFILALSLNTHVLSIKRVRKLIHLFPNMIWWRSKNFHLK